MKISGTKSRINSHKMKLKIGLNIELNIELKVELKIATTKFKRRQLACCE